MRIALKGLNHTGFVVSSLDRPIAFFRDCLGFELLSRAPRGDALLERMTTVPNPRLEVAHLQGPGHRVELICYGNETGRCLDPPRVFDNGAAHLALDIDDVKAGVKASAVYGLAPVGEIIEIDDGPSRGRDVVYLSSPDGLLIELVGPVPQT